MTDTVSRELFIPAATAKKLRANAAGNGSSLSADLSKLVERYADGGLQGQGGEIDIVNVADPGKSKSDRKVRVTVLESVWEQARVRAIMDETSIASAMRRATLALADDAA
jgi:hypothetical protein